MSVHNWSCKDQADPARQIETWGIRISVAIGVHRYVADQLRKNTIPVPLSESCTAIIDTGCTRTAIDIGIAERLGLVVLGESRTTTAAGPRVAPVYAFSITIDEGLVLDCIQGIGCDLSTLNLGALIGMDLLSKCIVILNGPAGTFSIAK